MTTNFTRNIKEYWDKLFLQILAFASVWPVGEQITKSWPRRIDSYCDLPDIYKTFVENLLRDHNGAFPYMILTPARGSFLQKNTEKLICEHKGSIYIIERIGDRAISKRYPINAIRDLEVGIILLDAWVKISGSTKDSVLSTSTIEYNSVARDLFTPLINKIRAIPDDLAGAPLEQEKAKFDYLEPLNFKFRNYAQKSILKGESVIQSILQPEFKYKDDRTLRWIFPSSVSTAHLTILTSKELILIRDDQKFRDNQGSRYGGIWQYIPLDRILAISITQKMSNSIELSIHLSDDGRITRLFLHQKKKAVLSLKRRIEKALGSNLLK